MKRSILQHGRSKTQDQNFCQGAFEHVTLAMSGWSSTFPSSFLIQHVWFLRHPRHRIFEASDLRFYQILSDVIPLRLFHPVSSCFIPGTVARVSQVVAQPRQHHADLIAIGDFQLRLFMAQGLDEGHGQIGGADAMKKTVVGGTWRKLAAGKSGGIQSCQLQWLAHLGPKQNDRPYHIIIYQFISYNHHIIIYNHITA